MRDTNTQSGIAATISKQEFFKRFLAAPVLERRSALETVEEPMTAAERFTWLLQDTDGTTPPLDDPDLLLTVLANSEYPASLLEEWIEALEAWTFALQYLKGRWSAVKYIHQVRIDRQVFIDALEKRNDEIGIPQEMLNEAARHLVEHRQDEPESDPEIESLEHQATIKKYLGLNRLEPQITYGKAAALALAKLSLADA